MLNFFKKSITTGVGQIKLPYKPFYHSNIDQDKKVVFIHIPKTGGTSINEALGFRFTTHATAAQLKKVIGRKYDDYDSFAIIRHPIERFISLYNYARMDESHYHSASGNAPHGKHLDYDALKGLDINACVNLLLSGELRHDMAWNQWRPQSEWVSDNKGNLLVRELYPLDDLSGLHDFFKNRFNLTLNISQRNKSNNEQDVFLSKPSITKLEEYYAQDFELYNRVIIDSGQHA